MNNKLSFTTAITTSVKPSKKTLYFIQEMLNIIPNTFFFKRKNFKINEIFLFFKKKGIKNFLIFTEKKKILTELWQVNTENNIFIQFRIKAAILKKNIENNGLKSKHVPELMFHNFLGNIGKILVFFFLNLFKNIPDFSGRQILFLYLIKNLIFIRYYRYVFSLNGKDVKLQELGPRITLEFLKIYHHISCIQNY